MQAALGAVYSSPMDKLRTRIAALLAKTVANGCTEAEALAAAAKAAELLDRHNLTIGEVELARSPCRRHLYRPPRKLRAAMEACAAAIAHYCDCKAWIEKDAEGPLCVFFGLETDLELAASVLPMVEAALRAGAEAYKRSRKVVSYRHDESGSFLIGMALGMADKLVALKDRRAAGNGRDLVPVKRARVDAEFAQLGLSFKPGGPSGRKLWVGAFDAGMVAGEGFEPGRTT
jgi:hypothetical protein